MRYEQPCKDPSIGAPRTRRNLDREMCPFSGGDKFTATSSSVLERGNFGLEQFKKVGPNKTQKHCRKLSIINVNVETSKCSTGAF